jgi:serine/threonine-protein kinase PpkA
MSAQIDPNAIPGYTLQRVLGRGGMATVYLGHQTSVDREVALKLMSKHLLTDPRFAERFLREARIAAKLQHRHVVSIYDVGTFAEQPFIAMEYLSGGCIMPNEGEPLEVKRALQCVYEIALALDYAHGKGFIHRDVKPDNILLREDGSCVLSDFGIARTVDSATMMTKTGAVVGTPFYMSPEQLRGKEVDGRADLYSLGVVFYQLLTGKVPYTASDSLAIGIMHMTAPMPALPKHLQKLQPLLDYMMAKEVGARVQTGRALAELVQNHLQGSEQNAIRTQPQMQVEASAKLNVRREPSLERMIDQRAEEAPSRGRVEPVVGGRIEPGGVIGQRAGKSEPTMGTPKGILKAEPNFGRMDPAMEQAAWRPNSARAESRNMKPWMLLMMGIGLATVGFWQKDWLVQQWQNIMPPDHPELALAAQAERDGRYYDGSSSDALSRYARAVSTNASDATARAGLARASSKALETAQSLSETDPAQARIIAERVLAADADNAAAQSLLAKLSRSAQAVPTPVSSPAQANSPDQVELALDAALAAERAKKWLGRDGALARYLAVLEQDPANKRAKAGRNAAEAEALNLLDAAIRSKDESAIRRVQSEWETAQFASDARANRLQQYYASQTDQLEEQNQIREWVREGQAALQRNELTSPRGSSAADRFLAVLALDKQNAEARAGLNEVHTRLFTQVERALSAEQWEMAQRLLLQAKDKGADPKRVQALQDKIVAEQDDVRQVDIEISADQKAEQLTLINSIDSAISRGAIVAPPGDSALDLYSRARRLGPSAELEAAQQRVRTAMKTALSDGIEAGEFEDAVNVLNGLRSLGPDAALRGLQDRLEDSLVADIRAKISLQNLEAAERRIRLLEQLASRNSELNDLRLELLNAKGVAE